LELARKARLDEVAAVAAAIEEGAGYPSTALIAQWAVESKWGSHKAGNANYFGIKRADRHKKFCLVTTHEEFTGKEIAEWNAKHPDRPARIIQKLPSGKTQVEIDDQFADYDSLKDSCEDYVWLISHGAPYAKAWKNFQTAGSVTTLLFTIAGIYATAGAYARLLIQISQQSEVVEAVSAAKAAHKAA
jgi:flagellum-specific peptidoglycan hydrolase FlgJ